MAPAAAQHTYRDPNQNPVNPGARKRRTMRCVSRCLSHRKRNPTASGRFSVAKPRTDAVKSASMH
eukprot:719107-Pleurochrysis_carterae.AAC.6